MKQCFKCGVTKPLDEFYAHTRMADGHLNKCKECTKLDASRRRHGDKREQVLAYDRARASQPHRVDQRRAIYSKWKQEHPDRRHAQSVLGHAVRSGKVRPQPCWVCGSKAEAHHPDYQRPTDVVWLCRPHHMQAHHSK